jgi:hypothetical protein
VISIPANPTAFFWAVSCSRLTPAISVELTVSVVQIASAVVFNWCCFTPGLPMGKTPHPITELVMFSLQVVTANLIQ